MKIVVLDGYTLNPGDLSWDQIAELGELTIYDRTDEPDIIKRIEGAEIVITNKTPLKREVIEQADALKYISVLATGYDIIDLDAARERNIPVSNVPGYGTESVAQFTIALLLELASSVGIHNQAVKDGAWENSPDFCFWQQPIIELAGKTMGIIGYGRIGQATGRIAKALGMNVIAYNPHRISGLDIEYVELAELYARSDVITLHCALTKDNIKMINKKTISKMTKHPIIINNARGMLINEQDLADALKGGQISGAGLDVVSKEPVARDNPLLTAPNCIITPHISWASHEARRRIMNVTYENINGFLTGVIINNVVKF